MNRLVTFHGQGSVIDFSKIVFRDSKIALQYGQNFRERCEKSPNLPDSVVILSHLLYKDYALSTFSNSVTKQEDTYFLGHSLGELQCFLNGNQLISLKDAVGIANYRHTLMKQNVDKFIQQQEGHMQPLTGNNKMQMVALLITKKFQLTHPNYIADLQTHLSENYRSLCIANINSESSVVLSGLENELDHLLNSDQNALGVPRKFKRLENPDNIAFHNHKVLSDIKEPLYDYIWGKLKDNKTHIVKDLNNKMISNYDGEIVSTKDNLLDNFVLQSCNTVQFIKCCETVKNLEISNIHNIGPVPTVLEKMIERNLSS